LVQYLRFQRLAAPGSTGWQGVLRGLIPSDCSLRDLTLVPSLTDFTTGSRLCLIDGCRGLRECFLCLAKFRRVCTFFLLPWTVLLFGMGYNNYDHHVGCKMTNKYDSANNFLNFYYTVLSFNEGYHVAHHINPGLHWSRLAHFHYDVVERRRLSHDVGSNRQLHGLQPNWTKKAADSRAP
jgi:hypothetical protein